MKLCAVLLSVCASFASAANTFASEEARVKGACGNLGVSKAYLTAFADKNIDESAYRQCAEHPMGRNRNVDVAKGASLAPYDEAGEGGSPDTTPVPVPMIDENLLDKRACYKVSSYGCSRVVGSSKGFCWKACGDFDKGEWCWTAFNGGVGKWRECDDWRQCGTSAYNFGCGVGCPSCGCSC